jgi:putative transcriptional regulator
MDNCVADFRKERGWTQADLAMRLDVSRQTVISLERGRYDPSLPLAFRIAAAFDCRIEDVFQPVSQTGSASDIRRATSTGRRS